MADQKAASERTRTAPRPRVPARASDLDAFRAFHRDLVAFTGALKENRCRRTHHFDVNLRDTLGVFRPLFAPWNMEILFLLYMRGGIRFNALKRALGTVSARVLTDKLRHLEANGLVSRTAEAGGVTYAITDHGTSVAQCVHPLVFYLHNARALADEA